MIPINLKLNVFKSGKIHKTWSSWWNPPTKQEMRVQSLGREDPLEEEMATHSREIPWTEVPGGIQPRG